MLHLGHDFAATREALPDSIAFYQPSTPTLARMSQNGAALTFHAFQRPVNGGDPVSTPCRLVDAMCEMTRDPRTQRFMAAWEVCEVFDRLLISEHTILLGEPVDTFGVKVDFKNNGSSSMFFTLQSSKGNDQVAAPAGGRKIRQL